MPEPSAGQLAATVYAEELRRANGDVEVARRRAVMRLAASTSARERLIEDVLDEVEEGRDAG